jgi:hypothetical protein
VGHRPLSAADSLALLDRVKEAQFRFIMDWRYQIEWDAAFTRFGNPKDPPRHYPSTAAFTAAARVADSAALALTGRGIGDPNGYPCNMGEAFHFDVDKTWWGAHLIKNPQNVEYLVCPRFATTTFPRIFPWDEDRIMSVEGRDTVWRHRARLLQLLDSAAVLLPGDGWIVGQRVRFSLDQSDPEGARRIAAVGCRAAPWWCAMLIAYVDNTVSDWPAVVRDVANARARMPAAIRSRWDDLDALLPFSGRNAYRALPPQTRDSLDTVAWWLADPLFLEPGNDRLIDQMLRRVAIELHDGDVDLWRDWRWNYQGPMLRDMVLRYGWPPFFSSCGSGWPIAFHRGDSRSLFLGCGGRATVFQLYPGPEYHTVPAWSTILDPLHHSAADWDIAPPRVGDRLWDGQWWAPEFYQRRGGPLTAVDYQIGMLRRSGAPLLAAAMAWDTVGYTFVPPNVVTAAALTMAGPTAPMFGVSDTMTSAALHGFSAAIPSGPSVLSLEMVPRDGKGTAGRARFGITAPPPLDQLPSGQIALSDPLIVRAAADQDDPRTLTDALARMLGTTTLRDPERIGIFWEVYGVAAGDTVDVSVALIRKDDANLAERLAAHVGIGHTGGDSVVVHWQEPRRGDPGATVDHGVSIRPRGMVLGISQFTVGAYTLAVTIARGAQSATARRELTIVRH